MWIYPQTLQVFKLHSDIRAAFPGTSFPSVMTDSDLASIGVYPVKQITPVYDPITQAATEASPALIAGEWSQQWEVHQLPEELITTNIEALRNSLLEQVTNIRWQKETGGLTVAEGVRVKTSIEDQNRITSVIANAELAGVTTVDFKSETGWVTLTVAEVKAIAAAIATHVQACFSVERMHHETIANLDLSQLKTYDVTYGWPT